jgi:hypothetical protein
MTELMAMILLCLKVGKYMISISSNYIERIYYTEEEIGKFTNTVSPSYRMNFDCMYDVSEFVPYNI